MVKLRTTRTKKDLSAFLFCVSRGTRCCWLVITWLIPFYVVTQRGFLFFFLIADELVFSSIKSYMRFCQKLVTDQISSLLAASVDVGPLSFQKYEIPLIYSFDFKNFWTIPFIFIYLDVPFKVLNTIKYFLISYSL